MKILLGQNLYVKKKRQKNLLPIRIAGQGIHFKNDRELNWEKKVYTAKDEKLRQQLNFT